MLEVRARHQKHYRKDSTKHADHREVRLHGKQDRGNHERNTRLYNTALERLDFGTGIGKLCRHHQDKAELENFGGLNATDPAIRAIDSRAKQDRGKRQGAPDTKYQTCSLFPDRIIHPGRNKHGDKRNKHLTAVSLQIEFGIPVLLYCSRGRRSINDSNAEQYQQDC